MDKQQTASQAAQGPKLTDIELDTAEWHRLTAKDKIEWLVMDSAVNFSKRANMVTCISDNIIHHGYHMYRSGGDFDEAMVAVIIAMKKSLDELYKREYERAMINPSPSFLIKP